MTHADRYRQLLLTAASFAFLAVPSAPALSQTPVLPVVNPIKGKQLTNVRASGTDEAVRLVPPIQLTLESAIEFIADDELVEITPKAIRIRKRLLTEIERKRAQRGL